MPLQMESNSCVGVKSPSKVTLYSVCPGTWSLCLNCSSLDIMELKTLKGLALHDILTEIHLFVHRGNSCSSPVRKLCIRQHALGLGVVGEGT